MANWLRNLLDFKSLGLFQHQTSVLGIDIGSSAIKVVQLRKHKGKVVLETYGELALGPYAGLAIGQATNLPTDKIIEALGDLFREANVTTRRAALSIPLRSSLLKVIRLPQLEEKKLQEMVPIEARKYIPVPISEVALDWWVIPEAKLPGPEDAPVAGSPPAGPKKVEVLLVAIHADSIKKYNDLVAKLKLEARGFEVETFSAIRSVLGQDLSPTVILDIGAGSTKMSIVDYGIIKVSHTINRGSQDITLALSQSLSIPFAEAEKLKRKTGLVVGVRNQQMTSLASGEATNVASSIAEYIFYEVNRVLLDYQKNFGRLASRVVLTGGGALLAGLLELARRSFSAEVTVGDPFRKTEAPAFLADVLKEAGPEFAIAIGLALRELEGV